MLAPVILSGFLVKQFGKRFELDVSSPREAVRALCSQLKGFEQAILSYPHGFRVWADRELLNGESELDRCTGACPIRVVPVIAGAKDALTSIVLGAAIIYSGGLLSAPILGIEGTLLSGMTALGTSLILGGVSQMLSSPPKPAQTTSNQSNLLFSGAINNSAQGNPVAICYGKMRIGSQVISAGIESVQLPYVAGQASSSPSLGGGGGK